MRENVRVLVDIKDIINKKIRRWEIEHAGKILEQKLVNPEALQWSLIINLRRKNKSLTIYKKRTISVVLWLLVRYVSLTDRSHTKFRSYPISNRCARIGKELFSSFNVPTCRGTGAPQPPSWTDASLVVATTQQQHRGRMTQQMNRGRTSRYQLNWPQTDRPAVLHRELWLHQQRTLVRDAGDSRVLDRHEEANIIGADISLDVKLEVRWYGWVLCSHGN